MYADLQTVNNHPRKLHTNSFRKQVLLNARIRLQHKRSVIFSFVITSGDSLFPILKRKSIKKFTLEFTRFCINSTVEGD